MKPQSGKKPQRIETLERLQTKESLGNSSI